MTTIGDTNEVPCCSWLNWNPEIEEKLSKKDAAKLALWLSHERKKEKSKLTKWIDSLPTNTSNFTNNFSEDALNMLKGSIMKASIE